MAPSAVPSPRFASEPRALTVAELRGLIDGYATAARHCREGGIDGIEVSMSHGYLIAQFFSPRSNRRADDYCADRLRFARDVLEYMPAFQLSHEERGEQWRRGESAYLAHYLERTGDYWY